MSGEHPPLTLNLELSGIAYGETALQDKFFLLTAQ
jgi:hypothetical protein